MTSSQILSFEEKCKSLKISPSTFFKNSVQIDLAKEKYGNYDLPILYAISEQLIIGMSNIYLEIIMERYEKGKTEKYFRLKKSVARYKESNVILNRTGKKRIVQSQFKRLGISFSEISVLSYDDAFEELIFAVYTKICTDKEYEKTPFEGIKKYLESWYVSSVCLYILAYLELPKFPKPPKSDMCSCCHTKDKDNNLIEIKSYFPKVPTTNIKKSCLKEDITNYKYLMKKQKEVV